MRGEATASHHSPASPVPGRARRALGRRDPWGGRVSPVTEEIGVGREDFHGFGVTVQTLLAQSVKVSLEDPDPPQRWLCLPRCPAAPRLPAAPATAPASARRATGRPSCPERGTVSRAVASSASWPGEGMQVCAAAVQGRWRLHQAMHRAPPSAGPWGSLPQHSTAPGWGIAVAARHPSSPQDGACSEQPARQQGQYQNSSLHRACAKWDILEFPILVRFAFAAAHRLSEKNFPIKAALLGGKAALIPDRPGQDSVVLSTLPQAGWAVLAKFHWTQTFSLLTFSLIR